MFQVIDIATADWLIGLGLVYGLAFLVMWVNRDSFQEFFIYSTMFCSLVVWAGLLPLYVLVVNVIILCVVIAIRIMGVIG